MSKVVNGRKALPDQTTFQNEDVMYGDRLALSREIKKELKTKGFEGRWVSYKKLVEDGGFHQQGWVAYKREKSDTMDTSTFLNGTDPDGYIRRGDAILAVKTVAAAERHRASLRARAERQQAHSQVKADELRSMARNAGMNSLIDDRPDEDEE